MSPKPVFSPTALRFSQNALMQPECTSVAIVSRMESGSIEFFKVRFTQESGDEGREN